MSGIRGPSDTPSLRAVLTARSRPFDVIHVHWTVSGNLRVSVEADGTHHTYHYRDVREWVVDMSSPAVPDAYAVAAVSAAVSAAAASAAVSTQELRGLSVWWLAVAVVTVLIVVFSR